MNASARNNRYGAMVRLLKEGSYFSDREMKRRDPLLYHELVGRHLSRSEVETLCEEEYNKADYRFSELLLNQIDNNITRALRAAQEQHESSMTEENDSDETDDEEDNNKGPSASLEMKQILHEEFLSIMKQRFLDGKDDFDYSSLDKTEEADCSAIHNQDMEDQYFDSETPDSGMSDGCPAEELDLDDFSPPPVRHSKISQGQDNRKDDGIPDYMDFPLDESSDPPEEPSCNLTGLDPPFDSSIREISGKDSDSKFHQNIHQFRNLQIKVNASDFGSISESALVSKAERTENTKSNDDDMMDSPD